MALKSNFKKYLLDRKRIEATNHSIAVLKFSVQLRQSIEQLRATGRYMYLKNTETEYSVSIKRENGVIRHIYLYNSPMTIEEIKRKIKNNYTGVFDRGIKNGIWRFSQRKDEKSFFEILFKVTDYSIYDKPEIKVSSLMVTNPF